MRKLLALALSLLLAAPASAQITVPFTFSPNTTILSSEVNSNFTTLASNALNRAGGTITGNIAVNADITVDGVDISDFLLSTGHVRANTTGTAGAPSFAPTGDTGTGVWFPAVGETAISLSGTERLRLNASGLTVFGTTILNASGKVPGFTSAYFASLDGSAITSVPEANIIDGTILARVNAADTITGAWTFNVGTITSDTKLARFLATYNNAAVTFTGLEIDVTNTASASASNVFTAKVGGAEKTAVRADGTLVTTTFQMTTSPTNGHVLTSDASGNASWAALPAGSAGVPAGMVAWFESACPSGWTRRSGLGETYENKFVRGGATYSAAGGGVDTHTHSVDPANTTSTSSGAHTHAVDVANTTSTSAGSHGHTISGSSASDGPNVHTHGFTTGGPSATTTIGPDVSSVASSGHTHSGTTGGENSSLSHSHGAGTLSADSGGGHTHDTNPASATSSSDGSHTHDTNVASFTSGSGDNVPAYVQVVVCKKD